MCPKIVEFGDAWQLRQLVLSLGGAVLLIYAAFPRWIRRSSSREHECSKASPLSIRGNYIMICKHDLSSAETSYYSQATQKEDCRNRNLSLDIQIQTEDDGYWETQNT